MDYKTEKIESNEDYEVELVWIDEEKKPSLVNLYDRKTSNMLCSFVYESWQQLVRIVDSLILLYQDDERRYPYGQ